MLLRSSAVWLLLLIAGVTNGILRQSLLAPVLGSKAVPLSGVTGSILILTVAFISAPWIGFERTAETWQVGLFWLVLTVIFEVVFGRLVSGNSWSQVLAAYNPLTGNLWLLVLATVLVSPYVAARIHNLI